MSIQFEWDKNKAKTNLKKHKVGFDEASTVFSDRLALIFDDEEHSTSADNVPNRVQMVTGEPLRESSPVKGQGRMIG